MNKKSIQMRVLTILLAVWIFLLSAAAGCGTPKQDTASPAGNTQTAAVQLSEQTPEISDEADTESAQTDSQQEESNAAQTDEQPSAEDDAEQTDGQQTDESAAPQDDSSLSEDQAQSIEEDGTYTSKDDVALYIHTYHSLPQNFITKKEAKKLGWQGGSLEDYAPGKCIGGDRFGNYEKLLPEDETYYECDIDTLGKKKRGAKRLIYTEDGTVYYTEDHYESFEQLY